MTKLKHSPRVWWVNEKAINESTYVKIIVTNLYPEYVLRQEPQNRNGWIKVKEVLPQTRVRAKGKKK